MDKREFQDILGALGLDETEEDLECVKIGRLEENLLRLTDSCTGHEFRVDAQRLLAEGPVVLKEAALRDGARVWSKVAYWWNQRAELLVDFDFEAYAIFALGEHEEPYHIMNDARFDAVRPADVLPGPY